MSINPFGETVPGEGQQQAALAAGESRAQQIRTFAADLTQEFGAPQIGAKYTAWMNAHPSADPATIYTEFEQEVYAAMGLGSSLGDAIAGALGTQGKITQQFGAGTAAGLSQVSKDLGNLFSFGFSWPTVSAFLWRGAKVILGGVMLVAGLLKLSGGDKAAYGIAGAAAAKLPGV